jgi:hypothetical protein
LTRLDAETPREDERSEGMLDAIVEIVKLAIASG